MHTELYTSIAATAMSVLLALFAIAYLHHRQPEAVGSPVTRLGTFLLACTLSECLCT